VMPGPVAAEITARLRRALAGDIVLSGDTFVPATSEGPERWITSKSSPLRNARGEVIGVIVVLNDITERKLAEEEIRRLNSNLERRVAERTAELQETIKDLESFSYSISHDLRAPLRHIGGFSQILLESVGGKLDVTARKHLEIVAGSARLMGQLVDDLLKFARLGRQNLSLTTVDMDAIARSVLDDQRQLEPERPVTTRCGPLPGTNGDAALLRQVLVNLVSNAFKYSRHQRQPVVEIGARTAPGETIYFVKDNGAGFDMRYADKLFGVFQRLHRHDEFEGTGVGLAIVQRIVHRHCGRVWAEAKEGEGATFYFALPTERAVAF
jgi:light-regulated signal transduction histidine kinase (bacteriophytochrome)